MSNLSNSLKVNSILFSDEDAFLSDREGCRDLWTGTYGCRQDKEKEIDGTIIRTHASNHGAGISVVES